MRFSREFVEILNEARQDPAASEELVFLDQVVAAWIETGQIPPDVIEWMNEKIVPHRVQLAGAVPTKAAGPGIFLTVRDFTKKQVSAVSRATTSFAEFLDDKIQQHLAGERLLLRVCPGCQGYFVQEGKGRDRETCSPRCKFRVRRDAEQKGESTKEKTEVEKLELRKQALAALKKQLDEKATEKSGRRKPRGKPR